MSSLLNKVIKIVYIGTVFHTKGAVFYKFKVFLNCF